MKEMAKIICGYRAVGENYNSLWDSKEDMEASDGGESQVFGGFSKREVAKKLVTDAGIIFNRQITKDMFLDKQHYETFTKRADELGLCEHRIKKWMFSKKDTYEFWNNDSSKPSK
jgi:hypothetical protein